MTTKGDISASPNGEDYTRRVFHIWDYLSFTMQPKKTYFSEYEGDNNQTLQRTFSREVIMSNNNEIFSSKDFFFFNLGHQNEYGLQ